MTEPTLWQRRMRAFQNELHRNDPHANTMESRRRCAGRVIVSLQIFLKCEPSSSADHYLLAIAATCWSAVFASDASSGIRRSCSTPITAT